MRDVLYLNPNILSNGFFSNTEVTNQGKIKIKYVKGTQDLNVFTESTPSNFEFIESFQSQMKEKSTQKFEVESKMYEYNGEWIRNIDQDLTKPLEEQILFNSFRPEKTIANIGGDISTNYNIVSTFIKPFKIKETTGEYKTRIFLFDFVQDVDDTTGDPISDSLYLSVYELNNINFDYIKKEDTSPLYLLKFQDISGLLANVDPQLFTNPVGGGGVGDFNPQHNYDLFRVNILRDLEEDIIYTVLDTKYIKYNNSDTSPINEDNRKIFYIFTADGESVNPLFDFIESTNPITPILYQIDLNSTDLDMGFNDGDIIYNFYTIDRKSNYFFIFFPTVEKTIWTNLNLNIDGLDDPTDIEVGIDSSNDRGRIINNNLGDIELQHDIWGNPGKHLMVFEQINDDVVEEEKANTPLSTWYYINYRTTVPDWENGDTILDVYKTHNGYYWEQVGRLDKQSSGLNIDINALFESSLIYFQKSLFFIGQYSFDEYSDTVLQSIFQFTSSKKKISGYISDKGWYFSPVIDIKNGTTFRSILSNITTEEGTDVEVFILASNYLPDTVKNNFVGYNNGVLNGEKFNYRCYQPTQEWLDIFVEKKDTDNNHYGFIDGKFIDINSAVTASNENDNFAIKLLSHDNILKIRTANFNTAYLPDNYRYITLAAKLTGTGEKITNENIKHLYGIPCYNQNNNLSNYSGIVEVDYSGSFYHYDENKKIDNMYFSNDIVDIEGNNVFANYLAIIKNNWLYKLRSNGDIYETPLFTPTSRSINVKATQFDKENNVLWIYANMKDKIVSDQEQNDVLFAYSLNHNNNDMMARKYEFINDKKHYFETIDIFSTIKETSSDVSGVFIMGTIKDDMDNDKYIIRVFKSTFTDSTYSNLIEDDEVDYYELSQEYYNEIKNHLYRVKDDMGNLVIEVGNLMVVSQQSVEPFDFSLQVMIHEIPMNDTNLNESILWSWKTEVDKYNGNPVNKKTFNLTPDVDIDEISLGGESHYISGYVIRKDSKVYFFKDNKKIICTWDPNHTETGGKIIKYHDKYDLTLNDNISILYDYNSDNYLLCYNESTNGSVKIEYFDENSGDDGDFNPIYSHLEPVDPGIVSISDKILSYDFVTLDSLTGDPKQYLILYYNNNHFIENYDPINNNIPRHSGKMIVLDWSDLSDINGNDPISEGISSISVVSNEYIETIQRFWDENPDMSTKDFVLFKNRFFIENENYPDNGKIKDSVHLLDPTDSVKDVKYSKIIFIEGDRFDIHKYVPLTDDE